MSAKTKRKTRAAALQEVPEENANVMKPGSVVQQKSNGLNLSDDDDSSDDDAVADDDVREKRLRLEKELETKKRKMQKKVKAAPKTKRGKAAVGVQLASLANIVEEEENLWKKKEDDCGGGGGGELQEVDDASKKKLDNDVAELLKMGEPEKEERGEDSDGNEEDLVDAGEAPSQGEDDDKKEEPQVTEGVEVTVALPEKKKAKRKTFDVEAYVRREIQKARRENQELLHKAHFLCVLAHLRYLGGKVSASKIALGCALSVVPEAHSWRQCELTKPRLASFVTWFRSAVSVSSNVSMRSDDFPVPLGAHLMKMLAKMKADTDEDMVLLLLTAFRALGWKSRLVINFVMLPLKPPKDDSVTSARSVDKKPGDIKAEGTDPKPSTSKNAQIKKKSSCKSTTKSKSDKESCVIDQLDGSNDIDHGSSGRRSSKSRSSNKKPGDIKTEGADPKASTSKNTQMKKKSSCKSSMKRKSDKESVVIHQLAGSNDIDHGSSLQRPSKSRSPREKEGLKRKVLYKDDEEDFSPPKKTRSSSSHSSSKRRSGREGNNNKRDDLKEPNDATNSRSTKGQKSRRSRKSSSSVAKLSSEALSEASRRTSSRSRPARAVVDQKGSESEEDFDSMVKPETHRRADNYLKTLIPTKGRKSTSVKTKANEKAAKKTAIPPSSTKMTDYFIEVLVKEEWVCVDAMRARTDCAEEMEAKATKPMLYVLACNADSTVKDVTMRYAKYYMTDARKKRVDQAWIDACLDFLKTGDRKGDERENNDLMKRAESVPIPTSVGAFKGHPLYALERHLLKFEAIYPPDAPSLGFIRGEPVYARECVQTLRSRDTWIKEGRCVRPRQDPYKVVMARPKWDRMTGTCIKDRPLEIFGNWQTQVYEAPPAENGKVPRNEYGNVELFKPWMLPKGTVHLPVEGLNKVARKLNIDCAPAMVGFDFHKGFTHPVYDGYVVCEEFQEVLMDAWNVDMEERARKAGEKREKRIVDNWEKLTRGLLIAQKVKRKYGTNK